MAFALQRDKIAHTFGSASSSYDNAARLQRYCGDKIITQLTKIQPDNSSSTLVDLGSGTGYFTEQLAKQYNRVIGIDIAKGMLDFAHEHRNTNIHWLQADAYQLPLADNSVDCVFSNLMIQWCQPLSPVVNEIIRILKPGGNFIFTTLIDGTLAELKSSWAVVDNESHIIDFIKLNNLLSALAQPQSQLIRHAQEDIVLPYSRVLDLVHELKRLGASHVAKNKNQGLMGKSKWQQMINHYEKHYQVNNIATNIRYFSATYRAFSGVLQKL